MSRKKHVRPALSAYLLLLMLFLTALSAQSKKLSQLDSIKIKIEKESDPEKKIALHFRITELMHLKYNEDSVFYYNQRARGLFSDVSDSTPFLLRLHTNFVRGHGFRGEYKKALKSIKEIEPVLEKELSRKIEDQAKKEHHEGELYESLNAIGEVYRKIGDFEKAYNYFIKGIQIAQKMKGKKSLTVGYNNLGILYSEEGIYDRSKFYYKKALQINKELVGLAHGENSRNKYRLGTNYNNLGNVYKNLEQYDSAEVAFTKSMEIMIEMNLRYAEAVILDNLANLYFRKGDFSRALEHERKALAIQRKIGSKDQLALILLGISEVYVETKEWKKAEKAALEAFEIAYPNDQHENTRHITKVLVTVYDSIGDVSNAYRFLSIFKEKDDLLSNEAKERAIENLKIGYDTERSEAENQLLKQKQIVNKSLIEKQKLWVLSLSAGGVLLTVLFLISYRFYKSTSKQKGVIEKQANKLRALDAFKSRFFANVSHDLRTPLTLIQGHIFQIKNEENFLNTKSEDSLRKLETNTGKLIQLTDEIKDLILLEDDKLKLNYSSIEIKSYLERVVNLFSSAAAIRRVSLNFKSLVDDQLKVHLDPLQLEKIIYNLLSNAFKFTQSGGNIIVDLIQKDGIIIIKVKDNGAGISDDKVVHIFDRFYQASHNVNSTEEGIGIGLALVLELVELHGGKIEVESKLGIGTEFSVSLPLNLDKKLSENVVDVRYIQENKALLLDGETGGEDSISLDVNEEIKRGKNTQVVLIVDDHPDIRNYIKELIEDDYIIRQAGNGKEALSILAKEKVDIVITDLMMPWLDGHGLIEEMKRQENLMHLPVLVVSARTTEEDKLKVLEQGVNDFLAKPFQPDELKLRIANALTNKTSGNSIWDTVAKDKKKLNDIEKNIVTQINQVILSKIDDPSLSVQDLADVMAASRRNANRLINEQTQMNPTDYIKHIRFQYVEDLMKKGKVKSLTEAAQAIGMSNATHFGKNFESKMGMHPSALLIH